MASDVGYINLLAGAEATDTLMRGFTTIRDLGGPVFGLKRAIDEGLVAGPAHLSLRRDDHRSPAVTAISASCPNCRATLGALSRASSRSAAAMIADSPDEVRLRAREQLMLGASQIKLTAGGGVASPYSPLDVSTFTEAELRAAVEAAENWGTYVTVHAYTPAAIQRAIAAGVKCIEHGHLMDEATAKLMAEKGIWLSMQPFLDDEDGGAAAARSGGAGEEAAGDRGHRQRLRLAKKYQLKTAFGTDILFSAGAAQRQGRMLAKLDALVHAGRSAERWRHRPTPNCWRSPACAIPIPASSASSRKARSPTCCWSTAIRWSNIELVADPAKNFDRHHEGRQDLQEHRELTSTFWCCRLWHLADLDAGAELVRSRQLRRCVDEADAKTWRCPS